MPMTPMADSSIGYHGYAGEEVIEQWKRIHEVQDVAEGQYGVERWVK